MSRADIVAVGNSCSRRWTDNLKQPYGSSPLQYTTSQFRSAHAHARSRADLLRSTRITSTSLNMHVMLAYASELRGCSSVAST